MTQLLRPSGAGCSSLARSWGRTTSVCTMSCSGMGCRSCRCCSFFWSSVCCLVFWQVAGVDGDKAVVELVEHLQPSSPASLLSVLLTTRPRTHTRSSQDDLLDSRGGRISGTTYTTVTSITTNNNTRSNNRACSEVEAGGLRARPTRLFRHYREMSSAPSSRPIQSGSIAPQSRRDAPSLRRASVRVHAK